MNTIIKIALLILLTNQALANQCNWSATHTVYDRLSQGCMTPKAFKKLNNIRKQCRKSMDPYCVLKMSEK